MKGLHLPVASTHAPSQHQAMPVLKCDCLRYAVMCLCSGPSLIISRWQTRVICFVTMLRITSTVSNGSFSEMSACRREPKIRPCCRGARNALQLATSKCCISLVSGPKRYVDKSDCGQFFPSNVAKLKPSQRVTVSSVVTCFAVKHSQGKCNNYKPWQSEKGALPCVPYWLQVEDVPRARRYR